ncbi:glycoside hydrolase family 104 protein [Psychrobacter sp. K31L]|uniref:glycoside hydrolase family 24 protein n=1 Tax=Psychrobacter sp. K31L TaxID=2820758 RepID=UPI001B32E950|nr:glycoside hydrolase family 104 protein [Psychrobacter sp. K31L]MBP3945116.1 glycoside hydrolase family 104 protein [Psychrobacter sp. K31L]
MATRKQLEQALQNPNVRKFLDLISYTEGTQGNGYRTAFGGGKLNSLNDHPRYLKSFTQTDGKSNKTSAAGRYQFVSKTWDGVARQYGLRDFSPQNQDLGAVALLFQRGAIPALLKGDYQTAIKKTGDEWASLPSSNYKQNKRSWDNVNKFLGGKIGNVSNDYEQPQVDPRLSMSAPDLLATLRKGKEKRSDLQILYELSNNNGLAGREIKQLMAQGENINDIASQLGLKVPSSQPQAAKELPQFPSFEEFTQNNAEPEPFPSFEEFTAGDSEQQPQQELPPFPSFEEFTANNPIEQPTQAGEPWQTQKISLDSTLNESSEKGRPMEKSSWESLS